MPDGYGKICVAGSCKDDRHKLTSDGTCVKCPDFYHVDVIKDNRTCIIKVCSAGKFPDKDAVCKGCGDYEVVNDQNDGCGRKDCPANQRVTIMGTCKDCPKGEF